jgi:hypothetical protein
MIIFLPSTSQVVKGGLAGNHDRMNRLLMMIFGAVRPSFFGEMMDGRTDEAHSSWKGMVYFP